jgi:hypothetical protein
MAQNTRKLEVDAETADLLEARAVARGMTVGELLADLAANDASLPPDLLSLRARSEGPWSSAGLAEDAQRLAEYERTRTAVPWNEIKLWLESWGTLRSCLPRVRAACEGRCLGARCR